MHNHGKGDSVVLGIAPPHPTPRPPGTLVPNHISTEKSSMLTKPSEWAPLFWQDRQRTRISKASGFQQNVVKFSFLAHQVFYRLHSIVPGSHMECLISHSALNQENIVTLIYSGHNVVLKIKKFGWNFRHITNEHILDYLFTAKTKAN